MTEKAYVMTGDDEERRQLARSLKASMSEASSIDLAVSFLMESGVRLLLDDLSDALERGVRIRILTGNYLGITQPSALYLLKKELKDGIDLRFYNDKDRSFHPKAYIFHYPDASEVYIGSSNLSLSAMTCGIEWNYRLTEGKDRESVRLFQETFEDLFQNHSTVIDDEELRRYSKSWKRPSVYDGIESHEETEEGIHPRGAQIEALAALDNSRREGARKALVQAATGIGKTYLAAFDSKGFKRVLFVAHREEILRQAADTFMKVRGSSCGFFSGKRDDTQEEVILASVEKLGNDRYLTPRWFSPDAFDYIVIDEFHHAVTSQYQKVVSYFKPRFLLGLTATPERLDGRDIYELCDYNVPYELPLSEAIGKGFLVPFRYYGIYDATDYSGIKQVRGHYTEQSLDKLYLESRERYELIYKHYLKHGAGKALGFCSSRRHAARMAEEFGKRGIPSCAVYSGAESPFALPREEALRKLSDGELKVIFSVDMFNEGLDVPSVDTVLFLRPTESPVVFLQQLGRGLRKSPGKSFLTVLDFIGNYAKAGRVLQYLSPGQSSASSPALSYSLAGMELPEGCQIDFDLRLIDLFKEMEKRGLTIRDRISEEFQSVREKLGHVPSRVELFNLMEDSVYNLAARNAKENPFRNYLGFLSSQDALSKEEEELCSTIGREFLQLLETTDMSKVYKMPVLSAFYNNGSVRTALTEEDLLESWKSFFSRDLNWRDLAGSKEEYLRISDKRHLSNIKRNPVNFLKASGKGFFIDKEGYVIALRPDLEAVTKNPAFARHMQDIISYRTIIYYRSRYVS